MRNLALVLGIAVLFFGDGAAYAEPESLTNESVEKSGSSVIKVDKRYQSKPRSRTPVALDPQRQQRSTSAGDVPILRQPESPKMQARFSVINVDGPKAPSVLSATLIKRGPISENSRSIRLVEFWATWCGPCRKTIPILSTAQEIYGKHNVVVIGYSSEEDEALVRSYVKEKGDAMNYTVRLDSQRKTSGPFSSIWKVNTIPHVYVVSHKGTILWHGNPGDTRVFELAIREAIRYRDVQ